MFYMYTYVKHLSLQPTVGIRNEGVKGLPRRKRADRENYVTRGLRIHNTFLYRLQEVWFYVGLVCLEEMSYVHKIHFYSYLYTTSFSPEDGGDMFL
jgi:hypothetical protein